MEVEISILTDEIDPDVSLAIESASAWGITRFEIRKISGQRVPQIPEPLCDRLRDALLRHQAVVTALSPGLFKKAEALVRTRGGKGGNWWEIDGLFEEYRGRAYEILDRTIDLAQRLGASAVILFSPEVSADRKEGECPERIIELIRDAAVLASRRRMTLLLENDIGLWADTGRNTIRILESVGQSNLKINWDPANAYVAGEEPFPAGYGYVKDAIGNVHAKDATRATPPFSEQYEVLGKGDIDWVGQIRALCEDGYTGPLCIETHSHPLREKTYENVQFLRRLLDQLNVETCHEKQI